MNVELSYDKEFGELMSDLHTKYGDTIFNIEGIGKQLDLNLFSKEFFSTKTTADASIDDNSNVADSTVVSYSTELTKPYEKLNSLYLLWKEMRKLYHTDVANKIIEMQISGDIYIHDLHSVVKPYCFNYSTYDIMNKGLPMINKIKCVPPKYLYSFKSQLEQFVVIASNNTLGATGISDMLIVMSYYVKNILNTLSDAHFTFKDKDAALIYIKESIASFVYTINQPFRSSIQSSFTNISIFDKYFLEDLSAMYIFEDGSSPDIEIVQLLQDIYLDVMNETLRRTPVTFPVTTACFSIDENNEFRDKDFVKYIIEKNKEFGFINLYSGKSTTMSSCCFDGSQKVLYKSNGIINSDKISSVCELNDDVQVLYNGEWNDADKLIIPSPNEMYKITTYNNKELYVTPDHINKTLNGDKYAYELSVNDYIQFNNHAFDGNDDTLTYEQGYFIGMYIGDGSLDKNNGIIFSLNARKLQALDIIQKAINDWNITCNVHVHNGDNNVVFVRIYSKDMVNVLQTYISGRNCVDKRVINVLNYNKSFRQGIIDGWHWTDGGTQNRIYTSNKDLIEFAEVLFTSLGYNTTIGESDRRGDNTCIIRGVSYNRNYISYYIKWHARDKDTKYRWYRFINGEWFFKIKSIESYIPTDKYVYCFRIKGNAPKYFTLSNGIETSNCRLRSDMESIGYANSIGGSSTKIGSIGVVTINMYRLAKKSKDVDEFKTKLAELVGVAARVNHARRTIIRKKIERGYAPLYTWDFVSLDKQFSTCGINGFYEAMCELGIDITSEAGLKQATEIIDVVNNENRKYDKSFGYSHNCEQVPGESLSVKIAQKDKLLGYNTEYELYSNQFIPLTASADILERIKIQGALDSHFSGGSILHLNFDKRIDDVDKIYDILQDAVKQGVIYMAINYVLNECENGHMSVGNIEICPVCAGKLSNKFSRIVGYLSNVKNWNKVRRTFDFPNRKFYKVET